MEKITMQVLRTDISKVDIFKDYEFSNAGNEPLKIDAKDFSAIIISESAWREIEETLYLLSIPGMRESLLQGKDTPINECTSELFA